MKPWKTPEEVARVVAATGMGIASMNALLKGQTQAAMPKTKEEWEAVAQIAFSALLNALIEAGADFSGVKGVADALQQAFGQYVAGNAETHDLTSAIKFALGKKERNG